MWNRQSGCWVSVIYYALPNSSTAMKSQLSYTAIVAMNKLTEK